MIEETTFLNIDQRHYDGSYKQLCPSESGKKRKDVVFPTMWELFVWAAIIGYQNKKSIPIRNKYKSPPFRWQVIKEPHRKLLMVMAVESVGSFEILKDGNVLKTNIEEHSNAGLDLMIEKMTKDKSVNYQSIESLIYDIKSRIDYKNQD
jgi:hypothetical protein